MSEEIPFEPFAAPEIYVDGFDGHEVSKDNILSCYGYRQTRAGRQVVIRLVMPVSCLPVAITRASHVMDTAPLIALIDMTSKPTH